MKSQQQNAGKLKELKVNIEEGVVESFVLMSKNSGMSVDDLVVIAMKRFKSSHSDYLGKETKTD